MGVEQGKITLEDSFKCDDEKYTDVYVYVCLLLHILESHEYGRSYDVNKYDARVLMYKQLAPQCTVT